jgi:hypothetical protein
MRKRFLRTGSMIISKLRKCMIIHSNRNIRGALWPRGQCARRVIAEAKQHWSVIGRVTNNVLSRAPPLFGRHVKPLVPAAFAVVSTHQSALGLRRGYIPLSLWVIYEYKEGLCPNSGDFNRLMMLMM